MKKDNLIIDGNRDKLDFQLVHGFISNSYWGKGRTISDTQKAIDNSLNFGVYKDGSQIGYARVITDYAVFAYLLDLFIVEQERNKGYAKELIAHILNHKSLYNVTIWKLSTQDAQGLYESFGFRVTNTPENEMIRKNP